MYEGTEAVTVREARREDLLAILRIERSCFADPWPFAAFESLLEEFAFLVATRNDAVVGYVVGTVMPNFGRDIGHVKDLAVHPDARGQGIGRELLRSALVRMGMQGAVVVKLEVRESNDSARSLYREEGFEPVRRVSRYYSDGEDALVMLVDLDDWTADPV